MEKINKIELMKKLNLAEEEPETVASGSNDEHTGLCQLLRDELSLKCKHDYAMYEDDDKLDKCKAFVQSQYNNCIATNY